jgi:flagellar M-ring protein FliF
METLLKQLRELPRLIAGLPAGLRLVALLGAVAAIGLGVWNAVSSAEQYQYAFTNLTPEDSAEAAAALKAAAVPFRMEAGGTALAVPTSKVYDARLLLAGAGLPRGGGVGFEIFDRGDLGVSEFTQKVNLRRATEGELARTISKLAEVRSARVHLTLPEKGLYKDQDRNAAASVVVNLQSGRALGERELAGIRHLVASAVPGLAPASVSVMDGRGQVLTSDGALGEAMSFQRRLEKDLEQRVVDLLEQAVGAGAVVARITAAVDANEVQTSSQVVDPESATVRSERKLSQQTITSGATAGGLAGAAGNQPLAAAGPGAGSRGGSQSTTEDQTRNFDVTTTTTTTVSRVPRLQRISVAVLVDGKEGKPRADGELQRLGELAKRAVGFDTERGDTFEISSSPFVRTEEGPAVAAPPPSWTEKPLVKPVLYGVGGLIALAIVAFALRGRGASGPGQFPILPGARVAEIEAALAREAGVLPPGAHPALPDPAASLRERAKELATKDPARAASILRAWMASEQNSPANRTPANG